MRSKKDRAFQPRLIDANIQIERDIFQDRLQRQDLIKNHFGLKAVPTTLPEESLLIRGFATVLNQAQGDIALKHPFYNLSLVVNQTVGAKYGYLISCGDYQAQLLEMLHRYLKPKDKVLEIGAGLGVTTTFMAQHTGHKVTAVEPQLNLHPIIEKNAQINNVAVEVIHATLTPENSQEKTDFYIMQDYLTSSIFEKWGQVDKTLKVPQITFAELAQKSDANTLVFDVIGAEIAFVYDDEIARYQKIICTLNTPLIGEEKTAHIINHLIQKGFNLKNILGLTFVFTKK